MYDEDLTSLENGVRRLRVEYVIFFNGHRKRPPEDLKMRVEKLVKKLSEARNMSYPQRFRYNTLISRFYVLRDFWRRTQLERESVVSDKKHANQYKKSEPVGVGVDGIQVAISDPEKEETKVRRLYDALREIKGKYGERPPSISYLHFVKYITQQTQGIQGKFGYARVLFTVSVQQNAIKFTARVENDPNQKSSAENPSAPHPLPKNQGVPS